QFTLNYDMTPDANLPPIARVGLDRTVTLPNSAALNGTVSDDGLPDSPAALVTRWSQVSGPGTVTFGNTSAVDTAASFSEAGPYLVQLTADDGEKVSSADVVVLVNPQTPQLVKLDVEAESGRLTAPMVARSSNTASGEKFVVSPEGSGTNFDDVAHGGPGQVSLSFKVPQGGAYAIWARTRAPNANSDSFYVTSSGSLITRWLVPISTGWKWHKVAEVFLGAGAFKLEFRQRDDGTQLDKVILTNDLKFVP
ncbi:MAG: PKD domain-containing protein, partial [Candidatus Binatia bacterium]